MQVGKVLCEVMLSTNVCRQTTESTAHLCDGVTATATLHKMEKADIVSVESDKQTTVKCPML